MPRADKPMSKQPTRAGVIDFTYDLLGIATLNALKKAGEILDFKGEGKQAKIKKPGTTRFTDVTNKENTKFLEKKFKQNPQAFTPEKPKKQPPKTEGLTEEKPEPEPEEKPEEIPEEELKDKPSDIRRQEEARKKAEEEARLKAEEEAKLKETEEDKISMDHPLNKLLMNLSKLKDPLTRKKILAAARRVYNQHKLSGTLPKKIIAPSKGTFFKRTDSAQKKLFNPDIKKHTTSIDKAQVSRSAFINDLKEMGGYESIPEASREAFIYYIASIHAREPMETVNDYAVNRQAFMAKVLRGWQATGNRPAYEAMSRDGVNINTITEDMVDDYETRIMWEKVPEEPRPEERPEEPEPQPEPEPEPEERPAPRVSALDTGELERLIAQASTDRERKERIQDFIEVNAGRLQRAGQTGADVIRMISQIPALRDAAYWIPIITGLVQTYYALTGGVDETDPVKIEAELRRLREQLQNLRVAKLNEEQEEQSFKERRKFRPEIREFNPERLNYFVSQEHEDLEKKELVEFAYIPEVSQAGVYTEDYKDNPLVMGNIKNQDIRFSNPLEQPMDYHPVGTYMLLDRIGKQMSEIRRDFNKALASMRYQRRADDGKFNQVWIPRIPPSEQPRKRTYRDMTDDAMKFATEPIVSLPKIDDNGVGATNAQRDFTTSYSYRRHYVK